MICPLSYNSKDNVHEACKRTRCAWWDAQGKQCAVVAVKNVLANCGDRYILSKRDN